MVGFFIRLPSDSEAIMLGGQRGGVATAKPPLALVEKRGFPNHPLSRAPLALVEKRGFPNHPLSRAPLALVEKRGFPNHPLSRAPLALVEKRGFQVRILFVVTHFLDIDTIQFVR